MEERVAAGSAVIGMAGAGIGALRRYFAGSGLEASPALSLRASAVIAQLSEPLGSLGPMFPET